MTQGKPRDVHKERQWRRWMRTWRTSGLTVAAFCARHSLTQANFYYWRRQLQERDAARAAFVPVQVLRDPEPCAPGSGVALEVILAGGRAVRVTPGFDAATLRQVLAVLEDRPC